MKKVTGFIRETWAESKNIDWATRKEVYSYTISVIVAVCIFALLFLMVDSLSYYIVHFLVGLGR